MTEDRLTPSWRTAGAGGINPAGVTGWFAYRRVGADTPTATALRVHNNA